MTVMSVSEVYSQATTTKRTEDTVLGKDDFLTLLVAQLQHQDPLNPSDSTEFTAQLAQFSSLEQLQNVNDTLSNFKVYQSTLNNIESANFIGKTVTASGETLAVKDGSADPISVELAGDCHTVYVQIYDASGQFVTDIDAGGMPAGKQFIDWNATDANGQPVGDGIYKFSVVATDADGNRVATTSFVTGTVTGIDYETGETKLLIGDQEIPIASVIRVETMSDAENG